MEFVYKYTRKKDNKTLYVGRTSDIDRRIIEHSKEPRFKDEIWEIHFIDCATRTDSEALEAHFIDVYKTATGEGFNSRKNNWGHCSFVNHIVWKKYIPINLSDKDLNTLNARTYESVLGKRIKEKEARLIELENLIKEAETKLRKE